MLLNIMLLIKLSVNKKKKNLFFNKVNNSKNFTNKTPSLMVLCTRKIFVSKITGNICS